VWIPFLAVISIVRVWCLEVLRGWRGGVVLPCWCGGDWIWGPMCGWRWCSYVVVVVAVWWWLEVMWSSGGGVLMRRRLDLALLGCGWCRVWEFFLDIWFSDRFPNLLRLAGFFLIRWGFSNLLRFADFYYLVKLYRIDVDCLFSTGVHQLSTQGAAL
jgi:hypothetical protein